MSRFFVQVQRIVTKDALTLSCQLACVRGPFSGMTAKEEFLGKTYCSEAEK